MLPSKWKRFWLGPLGTLCVAGPLAHAATTDQMDAALANGRSWLVSHERSAGAWSAPTGLEIAAATEAIQALCKAGRMGSRTYRGIPWWMR